MTWGELWGIFGGDWGNFGVTSGDVWGGPTKRHRVTLTVALVDIGAARICGNPIAGGNRG